MSYGAPYGYGSGYGYGVTGFVGILDRLSVQPYSFWSAARRASSRYSGPVGRIYRTSDGAEIDIYGRGSLGLVDPDEIAAFAPTGNAIWTKLYDQTGAGRHFEQASNLIMPYACRQGVPVTENGIQSAEFVVAEGRRMAVPSSSGSFNFMHTTGGSIHSIARPTSTDNAKVIVGNKNVLTAQGIQFQYNSSEVLSIDIGRLDVAGVATGGRSVSAAHHAGSIQNMHGLAVVDPDNPSPADRSKLYYDNLLGTIDNAESGTPFVEDALGNLTLGDRRTTSSLPFDGTISELAIWDSLIDSGDRGLLWSDASSLWGL